jgi:type VI secretion system VasD/TssJ family lipoprotein
MTIYGNLKKIVRDSTANKEIVAMRFRTMPFLCIVALVLSACAAQPIPPPQWGYEKDAIQLDLKADSRLNLDDGAPHTLVLCTYQLRDPISFNQLSEDMAGISKLLACGMFDTSVTTSRRVTVHPGQDQSIKLDRAAGTQYVAVVAGYYTLHKERMIRLFDIPVVIDETGLIRRTKTARPGPVTINLYLGPLQIEK